MPIPDLRKAASQPPAPHSAPPIHTAPTVFEAAQPLSPPPPPAAAEGLGGPSPPVTSERTMAMPIPDLMRGASQPPAKGFAPKPPAPPPAPVQPPKPAMPPPVGAGRTPEARPPSEAAVTPSAQPPAKGAPPAPEKMPSMERATPLQVSTPQAVAEPQVEPTEAPGAALPAPKSKLFPVMSGGVAVVVLAAGILGYWKFHQSRTTPPPQPAVAQTAPETPPPVAAPTPVETPPQTAVETPAPTPTPPPETAQPTAQAKTTPALTKKTAVKKPKPTAAPVAPAPEPTPPSPQPQPVAVTPSPQPSPPAPSPEEAAKAEAARIAKIPKIVMFVFNFGFKEVSLTFLSGGQPVFEHTYKGKKQKGGFLGLKGSYQGSYKDNFQVPGGVSEISIHVVSKDGDYDAVKSIKMPAPGGFVPTLAVEVDSDHLALNWQNPATTK